MILVDDHHRQVATAALRTVTVAPSEMSAMAKLYSVSRFIRITVCSSIDVGARLCRTRLPHRLRLQGDEHPIRLGAHEVVDTHHYGHRVLHRRDQEAESLLHKAPSHVADQFGCFGRGATGEEVE